MSDGYFPAGSMLRRVQSERAVGLLYGQRALMVGSLHPLAFIGTTQRSKAHKRPWRRLMQTAEFFEAIFFGTREEADRALAITERMHDRVRGDIPAAAGPFPAGTSFSAYDPELMMWVVAPMYDSACVLYELLVKPLKPLEREQLWNDYRRFGELFGMPREAAPPTVAALDAWWDERRNSDEIFLTPAARAVGRSIGTRIPVPAYARAPMRAANLVLVGSLPPWIREEYGMSWSPGEELAFRTIAAASRAGRPFTPAAVKRGSCLPMYGLVEKQERARLSAGKSALEMAA
ncbi:MAG: DUF2236 domain-containing protein [Solirubrobacteraceae bacterium]|nr:DUF2236 domain-containing protein [Solirubrobacteraceae bacterium]